MKRTRALLIGLVLVVAACGDDATSTTTTEAATTTSAPTTTAAPTTTSAATTTATTAPGTTAAPSSTAAPTTTAAAAPTAVPSGSGCSPPGTTLPDGDWFGFIEGVDLVQGEIMFDLACHFEGSQADLAAAADGHPTPLEFYPYVRNQNPLVFVLTIGVGAIHEDWQGVEQPFANWVTSRPPDDGCSDAGGYFACATWIRVDGGTLVRVFDPLPEWAGDGRD